MSEIIFPDIPLENVKGVLIDLDNTIYNFDNCHEKALKCCYLMNNLGESFSEFKDRYMRHRQIMIEKLYQLPSCRSRTLTFQNMMEDMGIKNPYDMALKYGECYWANFLNFIEVDKKALEFLKICKEKSIPVCLVTDMLVETQIKKVVRLGIMDYIDFIVASEEVGVEKPDAKMFNAGLLKLNLSADNVIMVGDSIEKDIKGAEALNIKTHLVTVLNSKRPAEMKDDCNSL